MNKLEEEIGFIGGGNMGEAIVGALIRSGVSNPEEIYISDISRERLDLLAEKFGVVTTEDSMKLFDKCRIIVLAVKPQQMNPVLSHIAEKLNGLSEKKLIISIAAGISMESIEGVLYAPLDNESRKKMPVVRVMPNTPALVLSGMSGMCGNRFATDEDISMTRMILEATGDVIEFREEQMDAVTAMSGSGPAYVFYLVESMIDAGIHLGFDPADASALTLKTLNGALKLMEESSDTPETLRKKVTSPGGPTEAAFKVLGKYGVKESIIEAIKAAAERSKELSGQ